MTKTQLQNHIKKISLELEKYAWRIDGLKKLQAFQEHQIEGFNKGFDEDIEYGIKISLKPAKAKCQKRLESIEKKMVGCTKIKEAITHSLQLIKEDMAICNMPSIKRYNT